MRHPTTTNEDTTWFAILIKMGVERSDDLGSLFKVLALLNLELILDV